MFSRILDALMDVSMRLKLKCLLFMGLILFPVMILLCNEILTQEEVSNVLVIWIAGSLLLLLPLTYVILQFLAIRCITKLNALCVLMKEGNLRPFSSVPPEPNEGDELQLLRYNIFAVGHVIHSRQSELATALKELKSAQRQVFSSIEYASLIQHSFLSQRSGLAELFSDHFLFWNQRDVVGGDFYWYKKTSQGFFIAVIDCTGHGVPGAFLTFIVHSLFERLDMAIVDGDPATLIATMNKAIKNAQKQHGSAEVSNEGMDCAICFIPTHAHTIVFAGAGNSLFISHADGTTQEIKGNRRGAGYVRTAMNETYTNHEILLEQGMRFYMLSDGLIDQIGGEHRLPFGKTRLMKLFGQTATLDCASQQEQLEQAFKKYKGQQPRRDDVTVLGFTVLPR